MGDIRLFPASRSRHLVARAAAAIAEDDATGDRAAWQALHAELATALLDQGVADERVDLELLKLFRNGETIVDRRTSDRQRAAERRRLRLVSPRQLDLFASPSAEAAPDLSGELAEAER